MALSMVLDVVCVNPKSLKWWMKWNCCEDKKRKRKRNAKPNMI